MASGFTSSPSVSTGAGMSSTKGTTLPRNSIMRRTPMSFSALTQNRGYIEFSIRPFRIPIRSSSSVRWSSSKNFSISVSSFSAAASTRARCSSMARGISLSGMSSILGVPPSGPHEYFFIRSTSIIALKPGPHARGYWTGTTFEPNMSRIWSITFS